VVVDKIIPCRGPHDLLHAAPNFPARGSKVGLPRILFPARVIKVRLRRTPAKRKRPPNLNDLAANFE
jgi:hypothetical protein